MGSFRDPPVRELKPPGQKHSARSGAVDAASCSLVYYGTIRNNMSNKTKFIVKVLFDLFATSKIVLQSPFKEISTFLFPPTPLLIAVPHLLTGSNTLKV